jgi:sulfopyruvate decarboxylase subunit alpha
MRSDVIIEGIEKVDIDYLIYLPCGAVKKVISHFLKKEDVVCFPVAREEEGIAVLAGLILGGSKAVLLIQDSGLGNSLLTLVSLLDYFHIEGLIIASRRGGFGEINAPLSAFAQPIEQITQIYTVNCSSLNHAINPEHWPNAIYNAYELSCLLNRPYVLLVNNKGGGSNE